MRWDELFADLEGQLEAGLGADETESAIEEARLRVAAATLRDRVAALAPDREPLRIRLVDGSLVDLAVRTVGRDWVSGDLVGTDAQAVLPLAAIAALQPTREQLARADAAPRSAVTADRIALPIVLRDLGRRRRVVTLRTPRGPVSGTIDRVGRDHLDLAVHPADAVRRSSAVARVEVLALTQVLLLQVG